MFKINNLVLILSLLLIKGKNNDKKLMKYLFDLSLNQGFQSEQLDALKLVPETENLSKADRLNRTVTNILEAIVIEKPVESKEIKPLWDLIDPLVRLVLLNQTQVQSIWNATKNLIQKKSFLEWANLPNEVKQFLLEQHKQNLYLNITFNEWGWVKSDSFFASANLFSLLSTEQISQVDAVKCSLAKLSFDLLVNTTAVKETFYSHHRILVSYENNEALEMDLPYFDFPLREFTSTANVNQPTVFAAYSQALGNLITFLIQIKYFI